MWFTGLALAAGPLDAGHLELASHATAHPGRTSGSHEALIGGSATARPWKALGLRLDADLGVLGPRGTAQGEVRAFTGVAVDESDPDLAPMDVGLLVGPVPQRPSTRVTSLLASQIVLTPLRFALGPRDLAFDLGLGAGFTHTADEPRPRRDSWGAILPDPARAQWHATPVASVGARLGLTKHVGLQVQARGLAWTETWYDARQYPMRPVWLSAGLCASAL
ncbi:MAG: hypothetical protein R3F61_12980 [Myxococcota bacterium]